MTLLKRRSIAAPDAATRNGASGATVAELARSGCAGGAGHGNSEKVPARQALRHRLDVPCTCTETSLSSKRRSITIQYGCLGVEF
jgi:hypothetical protein